MILGLPPGCQAAAFDISAAYRITPVRPDQQHALCIFWKGKVYVDRAVAFGLASSAGVFGAVADLLVAIYKASGFGPLVKWVDDFFVVRLPHQSWSEEDFIRLTADLGVPWSTHKTKPFAVRQRYIGFEWDLHKKTVALPVEKLEQIQSLVRNWLAPGAKFSLTEAASLHGKLVHTATIFGLIRPFVRSSNVFANSFRSPRAKLWPSRRLQTDLAWIARLLDILPNELPLSSAEAFDVGWWGDASSSFGIGLTVGSFWGVWKWAPGFRVGPRQSHDIGWAEATAVELGLRMLLHHGLQQALPPSTSRILVRSDNEGVVQVLNKGRSRSDRTNAVLMEIYCLLASNNLSIRAVHVSSDSNITDALSRGDTQGFLAAVPTATTRSGMPMPTHLVDKLISW